MSRLDDLVASRSPRKTEFWTVARASSAVTMPGQVKREQYRRDRHFPIVDQSLNFIAGFTDRSDLVIPAAERVVFGDHSRAVKYVDFAFAQGADGVKVLEPSPGLSAKWLYYCLSNLKVPSRGYNRHWTVLRDMRIPVPPLDVQREIVQILDAFAALEIELKAKLQAELDMRRRQYEHFQGVLFNPSAASSTSSLGVVFDMKAGKFIQASQISQAKDDDHPYPCFGGGGLRGFVPRINQSESSVLIGRQGALCGNVKRADGDFYATEHAIVVTPKLDADMRWAFHLLTAMNLNQYASKSAQPGLTVGALSRLLISVPTVEEQYRIGCILDSFHSRVDEVLTGLTAEITARRKQYEYYRDRLLTFDEAV